MTKNESEVLSQLMYQTDWCRPMDVGGHDSSHHGRTLAKLADAGLVERRARGTLRNHLLAIGTREGRKPRVASWEYKIKNEGILEVLRSRKSPKEVLYFMEALKDLDFWGCTTVSGRENSHPESWFINIGSAIEVEFSEAGFGLAEIGAEKQTLIPDWLTAVAWVRRVLGR